MNSKSLLIAIAAFAVTATGAQAYVTPQVLSRAGFTEVQVEALGVARELRYRGKYEEARNRLLEAGIDEAALEKLRQATHAVRVEMDRAINTNDFAAFRVAVAGTPLEDIVTREEDFEDFRVAHLHRLTQQHWFIKGQEGGERMTDRHTREWDGRSGWWSVLSPAQREAYQVAKQANDRETMNEILAEAGVDHSRLFGPSRLSRGH